MALLNLLMNLWAFLVIPYYFLIQISTLNFILTVKTCYIFRFWHYAIDGRNFALLRMHFSEMLPNIIVRGTVFARMLPEQKTQLIEAFQDLNYIVGMCGDGANDCGVKFLKKFYQLILNLF